jgi:hypothetical protein
MHASAAAAVSEGPAWPAQAHWQAQAQAQAAARPVSQAPSRPESDGDSDPGDPPTLRVSESESGPEPDLPGGRRLLPSDRDRRLQGTYKRQTGSKR